jgi:hypothetical protein
MRRCRADNLARDKGQVQLRVVVGVPHLSAPGSRNHLDAALFAHLAHGGGRGRFAGLNLAAGKLRQARQGLPGLPTTDQKLTLAANDGHGNMHGRFGATHLAGFLT